MATRLESVLPHLPLRELLLDMARRGARTAVAATATAEDDTAPGQPKSPTDIRQYFLNHCPFVFAPNSQDPPTTAEELKVEPLLGGNSNRMYLVGNGGTKVILRVYGEAMGAAVDRANDIAATSKMSRAGLGPQLLAVAPWGRVERFVDCAETANTTQLQDDAALLTAVAHQLKRMHHLPCTNDNAPNQLEVIQYAGPQLVIGIQRMLTRLEHYLAEDISTGDAADKSSQQKLFVTTLRNELQWLQSCMHIEEPDEQQEQRPETEAKASSSVHSPVVFSHNDLNPSNILVHQQPDKESSGSHHVTLLDFEYAGWNHRCFDLGNTMCELDYDYLEAGAGDVGFNKPLAVAALPPSLPCSDPQWYLPRLPQAVYRAYLHDKNRIGAALPKDTTIESKSDWVQRCGEHVLEALIKPYFQCSEHEQLPREHLIEVFVGVLASHLYWGTWAMLLALDGSTSEGSTQQVQLGQGASGLDYEAYGESRLREYVAMKEWLHESFEEFARK